MKKNDKVLSTDLDGDVETALEEKLRLARQEKELLQRLSEEKQLEAQAKEEDKEVIELPTLNENVDQKEALYAELEKMGCSRNYLVKMKERHGTIIVYPHEDNNWFVIRPLKVKEMRMIREIAGSDAEKLNKEILEAACVFPRLADDSISELPAGLPDLLVNMISRLSAFIPVELAFTLSKEL
ncbi:MAG: hypothetical protein EB127_00135 [Alphaproteobacteria bacterium]|nr:hypothetical protein [Alphaproteobacteria bacterium]